MHEAPQTRGTWGTGPGRAPSGGRGRSETPLGRPVTGRAAGSAVLVIGVEWGGQGGFGPAGQGPVGPLEEAQGDEGGRLRATFALVIRQLGRPPAPPLRAWPRGRPRRTRRPPGCRGP